MAKVKVYNQNAEIVGEQELAAKIFTVPINSSLIHQALVTQRANQRQVLAHTKIRSEVRGGGKKPWRQKGTGRARAGSSRSPIWIGGGVTFGPLKERNFSKKINKKMKRKALLMALSDKLASNNLLLLDKIEAKENKTKAFSQLLKQLEEKIFFADKTEAKAKTLAKDKKSIKAVDKKNKRSVLFLLDFSEKQLKQAGRNLGGVEILSFNNINLFDLLKYQKLVLTVAALKKLEANYNK